MTIIDPHCRLAKHYLILLLAHQMASALFRMIGALTRTLILANTFGGIAMLLLFSLGGFVMARGIVTCLLSDDFRCCLSYLFLDMYLPYFLNFIML